MKKHEELSSYELPLIAQNMFIPMGGGRNRVRQDAFDLKHDVDTQASEAGKEKVSILSDDEKLRLDIIAGFQVVLSVICVFFIGLGLRNRYKM